VDVENALFDVLIQENWRADGIEQPHAYLTRAVRNTIQGRDTDPLKRQAAKNPAAWLPASEQPTEYRIQDVEAFVAELSFDDDMKAYLRGRAKGVTRATMANYLTQATAEPWDDLRVERARKRFDRAKPRVADLYRGVAPSPAGRWEFDAPATGQHVATCSASVTHYKQHYWLTKPGHGLGYVYAHKWDRGHGVMDGEQLEAFREVLAMERAGLRNSR
jgi:hypothetical protein